MTWGDAAERILKSERRTLHYKDLTRKILRNRLVKTNSKVPEATCYAALDTENKGLEAKGAQARFIMEKGEVRLAEWEVSESNAKILHQAQMQRERVKAALLKRLRQLSGKEFGSYVEALLVKLGYQHVVLRDAKGDEGVDLLCEMSQGINQVRTAVQTKCKQRHNKVGPKDVRLLREVLSNFECSQGAFVTTSSFTADARAAASERGKPPIILIDADRLVELAIEHRAGVTTKEIKVCFLDEDFELLNNKKQ